jgi:Skp family chaperone for outer membrane proteins
MKQSARLATLAVLLLLALAAFATTTVPAIATLDFRYHGAAIPQQNRDSLERSLRDELRPAHPVRVVVTITDREVGTR